MGIKSPSLYAAFGSKEDLYEEVLLHYEQSVAPVIWGHMTNEPSPRQAVWLWLERSADMLTQTDMPHGCMVTLSAVGSEGNDRLGQLVRRMRAAGNSLLKARLEEAQKRGDLPASVDVEALTHLYISIQQGMSIQARDGASRETLLSIARSVMVLWPA